MLFRIVLLCSRLEYIAFITETFAFDVRHRHRQRLLRKNIISHKPMPAVAQKGKQNGGIGWDGPLIVFLKEKCFVHLHVVSKLTTTPWVGSGCF